MTLDKVDLMSRSPFYFNHLKDASSLLLVLIVLVSNNATL